MKYIKALNVIYMYMYQIKTVWSDFMIHSYWPANWIPNIQTCRNQNETCAQNRLVHMYMYMYSTCQLLKWFLIGSQETGQIWGRLIQFCYTRTCCSFNTTNPSIIMCVPPDTLRIDNFPYQMSKSSHFFSGLVWSLAGEVILCFRYQKQCLL